MSNRTYSFTVNGNDRFSGFYATFEEAEAALFDTYKAGKPCVVDLDLPRGARAEIGSCTTKDSKRCKVDAVYHVTLDTSTGYGINATPVFTRTK